MEWDHHLFTWRRFKKERKKDGFRGGGSNPKDGQIYILKPSLGKIMYNVASEYSYSIKQLPFGTINYKGLKVNVLK